MIYFLAQSDFSGTMQGVLIAAIVSLGGVVAYLFKALSGRMDADVKRLDKALADMQEKLAKESAERQKSDLKALHAEIVAAIPCGKDDCPKLKSPSFSLTQCFPSAETHTA